MAYVKNNWVDREGTTRYFETVDDDGALILTPDYTQVTEMGTPVNADNMNHIEEGIAAGSFTKFDLNTTYGKEDLVTAIEDGSLVIYKSLLDENTGNALSSSIAWEKISLGGGGGFEVGDIGFTQMAIDESKGLRRALKKVDNIIIQEQYPELTKRIKATQATDPDLFCTEQEWQAELTASPNGVCYKYVIDDEAGTIRLPKYPEYLDLSINGAKTVSVYGDGKALGLTAGGSGFKGGLALASNITTGLGVQSNFYGATLGSSATNWINGGNYSTGVTSDPTKSGLTGSVTTSSEQIKGTYFIQVATGAETEDNIINEIELNNPFFLGMSQYFETAPNNSSWLKSEGQWNAKAVYPTVYDWALINANNGIEGFKLVTDTYTDYDVVINPADETFRLPLKTHSADDGIAELSLYFYVGETVQNANLVNIGRIQETYTTKSMVDGQWVNRFETLASNLSMGYQVTKTFDLSNILPNDGYNYEVMFTITAVTGSTNGNCAEIGAQSDILRGTNRVAQTITHTSVTMQTSSSFILPVGGRRLIEVWQIHNSTCMLTFLRTIGYRRIGTNL